jgi:hypothetical protein
MINLNNLVEALNKAANIANTSLLSSYSDVMGTYFEKKEKSDAYSAKIVSINYPVKTDDNSVKNIAVDVPLITLVPISSTRIEELKFTTNLDIVLKNDELLVAFSNGEGNKNMFNNKEKSATATLEILLRPNDNPEGLKNIIEGYEKILRAQIPT